MESQLLTASRAIESLFEQEGVMKMVGGNTPFLLEGAENVWFIRSGKVEVFSVKVENGQAVGARQHFFTASAGELLFGMNLQKYGNGTGFLAVGFQGTELLHLPLCRLRALASSASAREELASLLDRWIIGLSCGISRDANPRTDRLLQAEAEVLLEDGKKARAQKGPLWISHLNGRALFIGMEELPPLPAGVAFPITQDTWLQALDNIRFQTLATAEALRQEFFWQGLEIFYQVLFLCEFFNTRLSKVDEFNRLRKKSDSDQVAREAVLKNLASILERENIAAFENRFDQPLLEVCELVGRELGILIKAPPRLEDSSSKKIDPLTEIARASSVLVRRVILKDTWWKQDCGPLVAYYQANQQPVALIPPEPGKYELYDPLRREKILVNKEVAARLSPLAYVLYRPFPREKLSATAVLRFAVKGLKKDILLMMAMGLAAGLLAMVTPVATGIIIDAIIPGAERGQLLQLTALLIVAAVSSALFLIVRSLALLRVETRMDTVTQAAVWDRLLHLPVPFFRSFTAGDLADRANGISAMRRLVSGVTITSVLGGIFAVFNLALLFYYYWKLALVAIALTAVAMFVTLTVGYFQLRYQRKLMEIQGRISGKVLQFITGISKLKVSSSEGRAYNVWARAFTQQKKLAFRARTYQNIQEVFNAAFPVLASMIIFAMLLYFTKEALLEGEPPPLTTGQFLAFHAAFGVFVASALQLSSAALAILNVVPIYERTRPILQTLPEVDDNRSNPGELSGDIEISRLSFRYKKDGPLILNNVSLHIHPGEFVAIVGSSGSGKSTLLRLLLGFEQPDSGSLYYDGQDLARLDIQAVRQQIGVVLQNGKLMPGDIFHNIVGSSLLTLEDAWEAARMAGLDQDIRQMPMGMHTVISEGGSGFSGGQKQRLMIARAIVSKPRIIFFDEATSALDNRTQAIVSKSLEELQATRVVIAHRLSTIINAHKIFVLENGSVIQQGTYQELLSQPGAFAELAKRQLA